MNTLSRSRPSLSALILLMLALSSNSSSKAMAQPQKPHATPMQVKPGLGHQHRTTDREYRLQ